jgi:hypothetical protein
MVFGKLMDALMIRSKWDAGVKGFFVGLKHFVETGQRRRERYRRGMAYERLAERIGAP